LNMSGANVVDGMDMGEFLKWERKVTTYSVDQLCVVIDRDVLREGGIDRGDLVQGSLKGDGRAVPFTKRVSITGTSRCIYIDQILAEAAGVERGDTIEVRVRKVK